MKKIVSFILMIAMIAMMLPVNSYAAEYPTWTNLSSSRWKYQNEMDGTDLTVTYFSETHTLIVTGVGAIPSYTTEYVGKRPWHGLPIWYIEIGNGVTSIGANAFSYYPFLMKVLMYANTFIEDTNAFWGGREECLFTIRGMNIQSRNNSKIPYTSLDSMVAFMQRYSGYYRYQMDNHYMVGMAQNNTCPKIKNLAPGSTSTEGNPNYPLIDYSSILTSPMYGKGVALTIDGMRQGPLAYEAFSILMGDNVYVNAYNISVKDKDTIYKTEVPYVYTMTVPGAFQYPGRAFSLIQIANGACQVLADVDTNESTVTFITDTPTGTYALVYTDTISVNQ